MSFLNKVFKPLESFFENISESWILNLQKMSADLSKQILLLAEPADRDPSHYTWLHEFSLSEVNGFEDLEDSLYRYS